MAVLGEQHLDSVTLEHGGEREHVPHVVVRDQHLAPLQRQVGRVQLLEHLALVLGQLRLDPVQEERRLVEQALR